MRTSPPSDLMVNRSPSEPGTRNMSPKEQKITFGMPRNGMGLVDHFQRRHANRAARPMHQLHAFRQQMIDAVLDDGVRLPAADLHQHPGAGLNAAHLGYDLRRNVPVAIFIKIFHRRGPPVFIQAG